MNGIRSTRIKIFSFLVVVVVLLLLLLQVLLLFSSGAITASLGGSRVVTAVLALAFLCCFICNNKSLYTTFFVYCLCFGDSDLFGRKSLSFFGSVTRLMATYNEPCEKIGSFKSTETLFGIV